MNQPILSDLFEKFKSTPAVRSYEPLMGIMVYVQLDVPCATFVQEKEGMGVAYDNVTLCTISPSEVGSKIMLVTPTGQVTYVNPDQIKAIHRIVNTQTPRSNLIV